MVDSLLVFICFFNLISFNICFVFNFFSFLHRFNRYQSIENVRVELTEYDERKK